jgi:hypothetical protein
VTPSARNHGSSAGGVFLCFSNVDRADFVSSCESFKTSLNAARNEGASASRIASTHFLMVVISSLSSGTSSRRTRSLFSFRHNCAEFAASPLSNLEICFDVSPYVLCIQAVVAE